MLRLDTHTRVIALILVVLLVAGAGASLLGAFRGVDPNSEIATGWRQVEFAVPDSQALEGLPGSALDQAEDLPESGTYVLNFWASFCEPCKEEMPLLERLNREDVARVIGISRDVRPELASREVSDLSITYANALDSSGDFMRQFAPILPVNYLPATLIVQDGVVRWAHIGPFADYPELVGEIQSRLATNA